MKMQNDCLPCIARGSLDAARLATNDEALQREVVKTVLKELITCDVNSPPPLMALYIGRTVKEITGVNDPYSRLKNDATLEDAEYTGLTKMVEVRIPGPPFRA